VSGKGGGVTILGVNGFCFRVWILQVRFRRDQEFIPEVCECVRAIEVPRIL